MFNLLMTPTKAAEAIGHTNPRQIYAAIRDGVRVGNKTVRLACVKVMGRIRVHPEDLERFILECNPGSASLAVRRAREAAEDRPPTVRLDYPASRRGMRSPQELREECRKAVLENEKRCEAAGLLRPSTTRAAGGRRE